VVVEQREVGRQRLRAHPQCAMAKEGRSRGRIWVRRGLGVALGSFIYGEGQGGGRSSEGSPAPVSASSWPSSFQFQEE
jgi:hypothetical protein